MSFDNRLRTSQIRLGIIVSLSMFVIMLIMFIILRGYERWIMGSLSILGLVSYILILMLKPNYNWFIDDGDKFILRFYYVHPFVKNPSAIEIPKKQLSNYVIKKSYGGLRKEIMLYQNTRNGEVPYPPVSISLLNKKQGNQLQKSINKQLLINKTKGK